MKVFSVRKNTFTIFLIVAVISCSYYFYSYSRNYNECNFVRAKADLFQQAISNYGPLTPESAANLWARGVQTRSGPLQYSTFDSKLKKTFSETMEKYSPAWVTGVSSPWVEKYIITENRKVNDNKFIIVVKFYLASSTGSEGDADAKLTINKENDYWYISDIERDPKLIGY